MFIHVLKPNKEMQLIILGGAKVKQGAAATLLWYCLCYQLGDSLCLQISEDFFWLLCCLGWCHHRIFIWIAPACMAAPPLSCCVDPPRAGKAV